MRWSERFLSVLLRDEQRCNLEHRWTFEGHQLGVVSVVADPAGNCKGLQYTWNTHSVISILGIH